MCVGVYLEHVCLCGVSVFVVLPMQHHHEYPYALSHTHAHKQTHTNIHTHTYTHNQPAILYKVNHVHRSVSCSIRTQCCVIMLFLRKAIYNLANYHESGFAPSLALFAKLHSQQCALSIILFIKLRKPPSQ